METPQIWEEIFKAGYKAGCPKGRGDLTPSDIDTNAEAAWQHWWKEMQKSGTPVIDCGTFSQK
jgi:hypothetical protein